jgi:hypothetical protein
MHCAPPAHPSLQTQILIGDKISFSVPLLNALWSSLLQCAHLPVRTVATALPLTRASVVLDGLEQAVTDQVHVCLGCVQFPYPIEPCSLYAYTILWSHPKAVDRVGFVMVYPQRKWQHALRTPCPSISTNTDSDR